MLKLHVCHGCLRDRGLRGVDGTVWVCPVDGRPIVEHAQVEACPVGKFNGPGSELAKLFDRLRIEALPGCSCKVHAAEMDRRGVDWCDANIAVIVGWLKEEARRQGSLLFTEFAAKLVVRLAIARARKFAGGAKPG